MNLSLKSLWASNTFSFRISLNLAKSILILALISFPVPAQERHPTEWCCHHHMLPWRWFIQAFALHPLLQINHFAYRLKILILFWSDQTIWQLLDRVSYDFFWFSFNNLSTFSSKSSFEECTSDTVLSTDSSTQASAGPQSYHKSLRSSSNLFSFLSSKFRWSVMICSCALIFPFLDYGLKVTSWDIQRWSFYQNSTLNISMILL